jgi:hypothetical protein
MKYLKLFEEFVVTKSKSKEEINLSDKTIDDVLKDDFLDEMDEKEVTQDNSGIYQIKNWKVY